MFTSQCNTGLCIVTMLWWLMDFSLKGVFSCDAERRVHWEIEYIQKNNLVENSNFH